MKSFLFLLLVSAFAFPCSATDKPNVVIILVDDMGYGDPGCFNSNSKIPTPNLDRLARDGMRFTDAHAPGPLCHLSRYGLMTGRYPFRANVGRWSKHAIIEPNQMTIASMMKSQGYHTAMVGKWHLGFEENGYENPLPGGPIDCGFESYFGIRASTDIPPYFYIRGNKAVSPPTNSIEAISSEGWSPIQGAFSRKGGIAPGLELKDVLPKFTAEAIDVIHQHHKADSQRPLMMHLAYPAPHTPWLPAAEYIGKSKASMYGDFVVMVDAMIGRVLKVLDDTGMSDNTMVIFTSDNGPVWYDEDTKRFDHDSSGGLRGMKSDAWEGGHRMPFIIRWPGKAKAGSTTAQTICFTDLMSTFAAMVDYKLPSDAGPDSFNFLPVILGEQPESEPVRDHLVMKSGGGMMTIRSGNWKLIDALGSGGFSKPRRIKPGPNDPKGQLYDLATDRAELVNLYDQHPDRVARMTQTLKALIAAQQTRP